MGKNMDLKDKIIGMALAALIALVGWNLHETWGMKEQVFKLHQGQIVLSKQIKKNSAFVKQKLNQIKKKQRRKMNKLFLVLALLFALSACSVGKKCTYTQDGTKISSYVWFFQGDKPIDLDKNNCT